MKPGLKKLLDLVRPVFKQDRRVRLAYVFGSRAREDSGPLSDYDFAVYFGPLSPLEAFDVRTSLLEKLTRVLRSDAVDILDLDTSVNPELKFSVIKDGIMVMERDASRLILEPRIQNEFFDFKAVLARHGLTSRKSRQRTTA